MLLAVIVSLVLFLLLADRIRKRPEGASRSATGGDAGSIDGAFALSDDCDSSAGCDGGDSGGGDGGGGD